MYAENSDRKKYQRAYWVANKKKLQRYARKYYAANKDKMVIQMKGWRNKRVTGLLEFVRGVKSKTPCADCGRIFHHIAMDFDHLPGQKKLFSISTMVMKTVSFERMKAEMAKCEIVCANCHRIRTFNRRASSKALRVANGR